MNPLSLRHIYLFESFSNTQLEALERITKMVHLEKGDILFYEGDRADTLHVIEAGSMSVYKCDPKGNEIVMGRFKAGDMIAEMPCFEHGVFPATARCESDVSCLKIDYAAFEKLFLRDPEVSMSILKSMAMKIKHLEFTINQNLAMDATEKTARFIYDNPEEFVSLKKKEIAGRLNMTPETLSRVIKKFKDAALLCNDKGIFTILDREGLKQFINN